WVLTTTVRELRDALGDDARQPRVIETVHRRGYRFIASVNPEPAIPRTQHPPLAALRMSEASPFSDGAAAARTILVGRNAELEALARWWRRAQAGERQIVFVIGEAGIGKTALTDAFLGAAGNEAPGHGIPPLIARGQCIEQRGAGEPYLPVLEAL